MRVHFYMAGRYDRDFDTVSFNTPTIRRALYLYRFYRRLGYHLM